MTHESAADLHKEVAVKATFVGNVQEARIALLVAERNLKLAEAALQKYEKENS